ncbi:MAG TPA: ammonia-forming cytochrome c nitrite reductase [Tenuifilaceae bacterium]|nr:ammonia-forming cytochrome c nitrite reductase [Tenuifilaceae bacterium]
MSKKIEQRPWIGWMLFLGTMAIVFVLGLLAASIVQRRTEANLMNQPKYVLADFEPRNEVWGLAYPREYQTYSQMADTSFQSKYNGSEMRDALEEDPRIVILFAGYSFAKDYNQPRGHVYAVKDIQNTLRTGAPQGENDGSQNSSCWACKSPDVPRVINQMGAADFYKTKWSAMLSEIVNPIGCANCHEPQTMNLRLFQLPFIEAYQRQGVDVTKSTLNQMRTMVCAQCHVEYYFKGDGKYVTFPWDKGMDMEQIEEYYDSYSFSDWTHLVSKAPIIKAQHPDFELFQHSIHYQRGVSCADCHTPYTTEGSQKITDHKVQSPLNNMEASCMVCHRQSKEVLIKNVYDRQDRVYKGKIALEDLLVKAHFEAQFAWQKGATEKAMEPVLKLIRQAQWRWDFVAASHGASFHAPLESMRIIADGINKTSQARLELSRILAELGHNKPVLIPDISTKAKAQAAIGLEMDKLDSEKNIWKETKLPEWLNKAKERENQMAMPEKVM